MVFKLQNKLIFYTTALIILIVSSFGFYLIRHENRMLLHDLEKRGKTVANGVANNCQFSVLAEDRTSLDNFVAGASKESDVTFAAIINKEGRFLAHSQTAKIDKIADTDIDQKSLAAADLLIQRSSKENIIISVPIEGRRASNNSAGMGGLETMMGLSNSKAATETSSSNSHDKIGVVQIGITTKNIKRELFILIASVFVLTVVIIVGSIIFNIIFSRRIFIPLTDVIQRIKKISEGEIEDPVSIKSNDEIGELSQSFNQMVKYISEATENARLISQGELNAQIVPRSEKDVLGHAFKDMVGYLQEMAESAQQISKGNITGATTVRSDKDILGVAFKEMTEYFREVSVLAQEISQGNIGVNIRIRSQFDVLGNSFKQIIEYLQEMANITLDVARGSLTTVVKPRSNRDIIGNTLSSMITGLKDLISRIQESSNQIHSRANEMASLSKASSEAIAQMASNVSQISVSITKISDTTQNVAQVAQKAAQMAETGNNNLGNIIGTAVVHSKDSAYQSADMIKNLGKRSMQIGEIINYITKVADQTNLLSLNAAIEAARAGEAGRGFAVVAEEVRKLAEGSAQSAGEISRLISEVQGETNKAVVAVEAVAKEVGESASVTQEAGRSFKDISQAAKSIAVQIEDIAASSQETAASAQEASASSEEQVATFEEISNAIENLKEIAIGLKEAAAKFKLS